MPLLYVTGQKNCTHRPALICYNENVTALMETNFLFVSSAKSCPFCSLTILLQWMWNTVTCFPERHQINETKSKIDSAALITGWKFIWGDNLKRNLLFSGRNSNVHVKIEKNFDVASRGDCIRYNGDIRHGNGEEKGVGQRWSAFEHDIKSS